MATLAELRARIAAELNRDDMGAGGELESLLDLAIESAIAFHADQLFWFNRTNASAASVAGSATIALPAGLRIALGVAIEGEPLRKRPLGAIPPFEAQGRPSGWGAYGATLWLSPVPDSVYAIDLLGIAELGVPAADSANAWTEEAADLIVETAKKRLCRGPLRDPEGAAMA